MKDMSTANNIITLNNVIEDSIQYGKQLHVLPIDLVKAYDKVQHWAIELALTKAGVDKNTTNLIMDMHAHAKAYIFLDGSKCKEFDISTWVRQGDVLAPLLFLLIINPLLFALSKNETGYRVDFSIINTPVLAYCDDIVILARNRQELDNALTTLRNFLADFSMEINSSKSVYSSNVDDLLPAIIGNKVIRHTHKAEYFKYWASGSPSILTGKNPSKSLPIQQKQDLLRLPEKRYPSIPRPWSSTVWPSKQ